MALDNFKNFAKVTVSTGYDDAATSVILAASEGTKLPTVSFNAVWYNASDYFDPTDDPNREIVRVTNISTDTLTVTRAQEGTSAVTHNTAGKTYKMIVGLTAKTLNTDLAATYQPLDADLTTWAGLTPSANAQSLVTAANYAAMRTLLDLEAGTDFYSIASADAAFQPKDATLTALAGLTIAANSLSIGSGADAFSQTTFAANTFPARASTGNLVAKSITDFGLSLIDDADASAARTTLGLVIGTNVQAYDADLTSWAGVTRASGFDTFAATPSSANLASLVTDETGTGALVFGTSPTFTTKITTPLILGGTATTQDLTFQTTSGVGDSGADMHFLVGNNGATEAMTILNSGNVGISAVTPLASLHVVSTVGSITPVAYFDNYNDNLGAAPFLSRGARGTPGSPTALQTGDIFGGLAGRGYGTTTFSGGRASFIFRASENWTDAAQGAYITLTTTTNGTAVGAERMRITENGNIKIAGTATRATTEGTNHLDIFNGTAPVGTLTNGISIYSSGGECYIMDAAGNSTIQSPHNKAGDWIFHSKNTITGKVLHVEMEKMLKFLEKKFGTSFIQEYIEQGDN